MGVPFRFIHAADLHLDSPFRGLAKAPEAVRTALSSSTFYALRRLTDAAIENEVDFVVVAGDLFDEADRSLRAQFALVKEWERLAEHGIAVYAIHGNHDHLGGRRAKLRLPSAVHIFGSKQMDWAPAFTRGGELAAHVYGMSYGERSVTANLAGTYALQDGAPYHIALLHGNVGGDPSHDSYAPCALEELAGSRFDYWALGHIHKREVLNVYPHVVYAGNTQGRNPKELGAKGCYIVDVSAAGAAKLRFVALDAVRWLEENVSIEGVDTEQELLTKLNAAVAAAGAAGEDRSVMLRLKLTGSGPLHLRLKDGALAATLLEQLQEDAVPAAGSPWMYVHGIEAATTASVDWAMLGEDEGFSGELYRLGERLAEDEAAWRTFAKNALAEMSGHPKLGKLERRKWDELPQRWLKEGRELAIGWIAEEGDLG
ncbi:DNA repair exonuclease [Paenibacillus sp. LHD-117]|uniref:metallophosphoesterase family protein n=1 Tax=Paenibacillus sp. LHD-117 TaxID=3071412 RepID=UPI0027E0CB86|nr:DNA repair exonuclease [Paenibacillus sp. LHD-117]MDQ6419039.1 DNA repair exonuclease [Paenibacillus sp. LHD-117]